MYNKLNHFNEGNLHFADVPSGAINLTITYVDSDIAPKRVCDNNPEQFSWHWPGIDESIHLIVSSMVAKMILSIVNAAMTLLLDPRHNK